ncbi:hypothetical protein K491DRAFT_128661 [Lophiostoma macrostomum CBS 122681]|uniref:Uncharacterized protein n=1 Tax=Lophiostoma macrostomum CBS 122681 TaxID=1314788 RepID=A0A6A6SWJ5_9PLEO|nr:hypothetical protein K491DRAFT_128661 [Lophiostoma macrostomum CBS 122681]
MRQSVRCQSSGVEDSHLPPPSPVTHHTSNSSHTPSIYHCLSRAARHFHSQDSYFSDSFFDSLLWDRSVIRNLGVIPVRRVKMANCMTSPRQNHKSTVLNMNSEIPETSPRHATVHSASHSPEPRSSLPFSLKLGRSAKWSDRSDSSSELPIAKLFKRKEPTSPGSFRWDIFRDLDDREVQHDRHKSRLELGRLRTKWFSGDSSMSCSSGERSGQSVEMPLPLNVKPKSKKLWIDTKIQAWEDEHAALAKEDGESATPIGRWSPPRPPRCSASVQSPVSSIPAKERVRFRGQDPAVTPADEKPLPALPPGRQVRQDPIVKGLVIRKAKQESVPGSELSNPSKAASASKSASQHRSSNLQLQQDTHGLMTGASAPSPELFETFRTASPDVQALVRDASKMQVWELEGFINGPCFQNSPQNSKKVGKMMLVPDHQIRRAKDQGRQIRVPDEHGTLRWAEIERLQVWELIGWVKYCKWTEYGKQLPRQNGSLARARQYTLFQCDLQGISLFPTLSEEGWEVICIEQRSKRTADREGVRQNRKEARRLVQQEPPMSMVDEQIEMDMMTPEKKVELGTRLEAETNHQKMIKLRKKLMSEYRRERTRAAAEYAASLVEKREKLHAKINMVVENEKKIKARAKAKALARVAIEKRAAVQARDQRRRQRQQASTAKQPHRVSWQESSTGRKGLSLEKEIPETPEKERELPQNTAEVEQLRREIERLVQIEDGKSHMQAAKVRNCVDSATKGRDSTEVPDTDTQDIASGEYVE